MLTGGNQSNLVWGQGATVTEWFLEPTCPNSARAYGKLWALLDEAGEDRLTIRICIQSQPWHLFSGVVSRAILAASLLPEGAEAVRRVMSAVFQNREEFVATDHSHGPNMDVSLNGMLERLKACSGVDLEPVFARKEVMDLLKRHTRYARQNGIHASPTVIVNGLVDDSIGSRDDVSDWLVKLGLS